MLEEEQESEATADEDFDRVEQVEVTGDVAPSAESGDALDSTGHAELSDEEQPVEAIETTVEGEIAAPDEESADSPDEEMATPNAPESAPPPDDLVAAVVVNPVESVEPTEFVPPLAAAEATQPIEPIEEVSSVSVPTEELSTETVDPLAAPTESGAQESEDGADWEQQAQDTAVSLRGALQELAERLTGSESSGTYRSFWDGARTLNEQLRNAQPIKLEDKLEMQREVTALCERARARQNEQRAEAERVQGELESALQLATEVLSEVQSAADVQQVRADLAVIRERLDASGSVLGRSRRQAIWERWQTINQATWQVLTEHWQATAQSLSTLLDTAQTDIEAGRPRDAREHIKAFRAGVATSEISRQAVRELQKRADGLWRQASNLSREKHQQYLENTGRRIEGWRAALQRQQRARERLASDLEFAERQASRATTDVAAALLRSQATERQRELTRLDTQIQELEGRIKQAEEALHRG